MAIPLAFPRLEEEVVLSRAVPVISLPGLVLMKLLGFRGQDQADVEALLRDDERRRRPGQERSFAFHELP